jgi:hypothetical protein
MAVAPEHRVERALPVVDPGLDPKCEFELTESYPTGWGFHPCGVTWLRREVASDGCGVYVGNISKMNS